MGDKVTLLGQVTRPTLKSDAEGVVKSIEGVGSVERHRSVAVLTDGRSNPPGHVPGHLQGNGLSRYALSAVPSIHIIVKNGKVSLEGVVDNETDKNLVNFG